MPAATPSEALHFLDRSEGCHPVSGIVARHRIVTLTLPTGGELQLSLRVVAPTGLSFVVAEGSPSLYFFRRRAADECR